MHPEWHFEKSSTNWNSSKWAIFGWQHNLIPYYFDHSFSYHFQKNRQAISRILTLNNKLGSTEGSMEWTTSYRHKHYLSRVFWHLYCLLNVGRVGEVESSGCAHVYVCMHVHMCMYACITPFSVLRHMPLSAFASAIYSFNANYSTVPMCSYSFISAIKSLRFI